MLLNQGCKTISPGGCCFARPASSQEGLRHSLPYILPQHSLGHNRMLSSGFAAAYVPRQVPTVHPRTAAAARIKCTACLGPSAARTIFPRSELAVVREPHKIHGRVRIGQAFKTITCLMCHRSLQTSNIHSVSPTCATKCCKTLTKHLQEWQLTCDTSLQPTGPQNHN